MSLAAVSGFSTAVRKIIVFLSVSRRGSFKEIELSRLS